MKTAAKILLGFCRDPVHPHLLSVTGEFIFARQRYTGEKNGRWDGQQNPTRQGWRLQDADMESNQARTEVGMLWESKLKTLQERALGY